MRGEKELLEEEDTGSMGSGAEHFLPFGLGLEACLEMLCQGLVPMSSSVVEKLSKVMGPLLRLNSLVLESQVAK